MNQNIEKHVDYEYADVSAEHRRAIAQAGHNAMERAHKEIQGKVGVFK